MSNTPNISRRSILQALSGVPLLRLSSVFAGVGLTATACGGSSAAATLSSVTFSNMPAPTLANAAAMATTTVGSVMSVNFSDNSTLDYKLAYQPFFVTGDLVADGKGG